MGVVLLFAREEGRRDRCEFEGGGEMKPKPPWKCNGPAGREVFENWINEQLDTLGPDEALAAQHKQELEQWKKTYPVIRDADRAKEYEAMLQLTDKKLRRRLADHFAPLDAEARDLFAEGDSDMLRQCLMELRDETVAEITQLDDPELRLVGLKRLNYQRPRGRSGSDPRNLNPWAVGRALSDIDRIRQIMCREFKRTRWTEEPTALEIAAHRNALLPKNIVNYKKNMHRRKSPI
jgi:hypothetical protein